MFHLALHVHCFNPSFTGIALVATFRLRIDCHFKIVSILLLLELPWWHQPSNSAAKFKPRFQSFFYWNCLGGLIGIFDDGVKREAFQSFFYWNCLGGTAWAIWAVKLI